jgi:hypothetical protein
MPTTFTVEGLTLSDGRVGTWKICGLQGADPWLTKIGIGYERNVHLVLIEVAEQEVIGNLGNLAAVARAADTTCALYKGQEPEVAEIEARKAASLVVSSVIGDCLATNDRAAVDFSRQYERRLDPQDHAALGME